MPLGCHCLWYICRLVFRLFVPGTSTVCTNNPALGLSKLANAVHFATGARCRPICAVRSPQNQSLSNGVIDLPHRIYQLATKRSKESCWESINSIAIRARLSFRSLVVNRDSGTILATLYGEVAKLLGTQREGEQNAGANAQRSSSRTDDFVSSV